MSNVDLSLDWSWLYFQVMVLGAIIIREFLRPRGRNLYAILIAGAMLVLVHGQAWWVLAQFESGVDAIEHLEQTITLQGARLANFYIGLSVVCFGLTYLLFPLRKRVTEPRPTTTVSPPNSPRMFYALVTIWTVVWAGVLLRYAGGFEAAVTKPGQSLVGGQTMALIMAGLGKLPLLRKTALGGKVVLLDLALFVLTLFLFLINSRFLTSFILLQLVVLVHYCRREVSRRSLLGLALALILILFVFGLYRDYTSRYEQVEVSELGHFLMTRTGEDSPVAWFYRKNVEGFTGLAGILTYEADQGGIVHDLGLSNLRVITRFIPSSLRNDPDLLFKTLDDFLRSLYPYAGSIVPSGMENAYAHFGVSGVLALGALLGYMARRFQLRMHNRTVDRLLIALISVHALQLIRGSFLTALVFAFAEAIMLWVFRLMLTVSRAVGAPKIRVAPSR